MMTACRFSDDLDEVTLAALRRGCRESQARVYGRYSRAAWNLALRLSGCEARAWDAVQDGFVAAFRRIGQYRGEAGFGYWLRRIVINQVLDQHRATRREVPLETAGAGHADTADTRWLDLERALGRLDPTDRLVVWLHDVEGLTHGEIAELAGNTESWSKSRLSRARGRLRAALEHELNPTAPAGATRSGHA